jgi:hypothetical protein
VVLIALGAEVRAAHCVQTLPVVEATTASMPEPVARTPATISAVTGAELNRCGASGMASARDPAPGAEAPAGGGAGPSSAAPSFRSGALHPVLTPFDLNDGHRIVGRRFQDEEGTAPAGGYTTLR